MARLELAAMIAALVAQGAGAAPVLPGVPKEAAPPAKGRYQGTSSVDHKPCVLELLSVKRDFSRSFHIEGYPQKPDASWNVETELVVRLPPWPGNAFLLKSAKDPVHEGLFSFQFSEVQQPKGPIQGTVRVTTEGGAVTRWQHFPNDPSGADGAMDCKGMRKVGAAK